MTKKILLGIFLIIAFVGFVDAFYLTINYYSNSIPPCFVAQGCDVVTTSQYAKLLGIPIALLGTLYYLFVFSLGLYYLDKKSLAVLGALPIITAVGFIFSLYLVYLQLFVLKALCIYCLFSAGSSTSLFLISLFLKKKFSKEEPLQV